MAVLVYAVIFLALFVRSDAGWCVCRTDLSDSVLQKAIDYACGYGADCGPILQSGSCYNPNTVKAHCNYAVNSYYQRKGQAPEACNFAGSALATNTDPSYTGCSFPASQSAGGTPQTTTPGTSTTTGSTYSPPGTGTGTSTGTSTGTVMGGLGPSGNAMSTDMNDASHLVPVHKIMPHGTAVLCFSLMFEIFRF